MKKLVTGILSLAVVAGLGAGIVFAQETGEHKAEGAAAEGSMQAVRRTSRSTNRSRKNGRSPVLSAIMTRVSCSAD